MNTLASNLILVFLCFIVMISIFLTIKKRLNFNKMGNIVYESNKLIKQYILNSVIVSSIIYVDTVAIKSIVFNTTKASTIHNSKNVYIIFNIAILFITYLNIKSKAIIFERGILDSKGRVLFWRDINAIECKGHISQNKRYLIISDKHYNKVCILVNLNEFENIKEQVFNRSGLIYKEIVL